MKFELSRPVLLSQHVDTLHASFKCLDQTAFLQYVQQLNMLEPLKEEAQEIEGFTMQSRFVKCSPFEGFGEFKLFAQGHGQYRYVLENDDIMIFLSKAKFESDAPHIKVEFRAHYLFSVGQNKAYDYVQKLITGLLTSNHSSAVMRLDLATDVMGVKLQYLDSVRFQNSFKSSLFKKASRVTGVSFGGGNFMFRIYDKLEQIKANYSRHYIKQKWILNGYKEDEGHSVTRFEAQFRRPEIKKYIPYNHVNEVEYIFLHLANFWKKALTKIKYAPLTNDEAIRIMDGDITSDGKRMIFKRVRDDEKRFQFQKFLYHWDNQISDSIVEYKTIKQPIEATAKRMLKGFVASAYKSGEANPMVLQKMLQEMHLELMNYQGMTLHDYGLTKVVDSFVHQQKMIEKHGVVVDFDYKFIATEAYKQLHSKLGQVNNVFMNMPHVSKSDNLDDFFDLNEKAVV